MFGRANRLIARFARVRGAELRRHGRRAGRGRSGSSPATRSRPDFARRQPRLRAARPRRPVPRPRPGRQPGSADLQRRRAGRGRPAVAGAAGAARAGPAVPARGSGAGPRGLRRRSAWRPSSPPSSPMSPARMAQAAPRYRRARARRPLPSCWLLARPSLLVPYPFAADDHQTANAERLADGRSRPPVARRRSSRPERLAKRAGRAADGSRGSLAAMAATAQASWRDRMLPAAGRSGAGPRQGRTGS